MTTSAKVSNTSIAQNLSLDNLPNEQWKPIKGFEKSHLISNYGRVKSLSRKIKCSNGFRTSVDKILKQKISQSGYCYIQLKSKGKMLLVHRIVASSFIKNPNNKPQVNHLNGLKNDNRLSNLEWVTQSENQYHAYNTGLQTSSNHERAKGEKQGLSKLNKEQVVWIKKNYKRGFAIKFGKKFNVSQTSILNIINKKTWSHVRV